MELFADYFASWLFALVADKSSRWLISHVIGDDVRRELRRAARAAVSSAARDVVPADLADADSAAGALVKAIDEAFSERSEGGPGGAAAATLLEALSTGIAARLPPGMAEELTAQLVREIAERGLKGGPLKPVADQLNSDITHLQGQQAIAQGRQVIGQGQQVMAMIGRLAEVVSQAVSQLDRASAGPRAWSTLPPDVTSLVGRQAEVDRVMQVLGQHATAGGVMAIDTINGMAGVGKTALAVHVAHALAPHFPDGQLYMHLHGHTPDQRPVSPRFALSALLLKTDFPPDGIPSDLDACAAAWREHMASRKVLLLLDDAANSEQVRPLLTGSPGSLVLVTSRQRLTGLAGARAVTIDVLPPEDAAAMFVHLADREDLSADDPAIAEVVRLCAYLPLAISLMAAQLLHHPAWTPADLVTDLTAAPSRLSVMAAEDLSVATAIDVSYQHLGPWHRRLFGQLSLCPGAEFDAYAAAALDGSGLEATARRLRELFEYNLLRENSRGRYSFHDLIREHARRVGPRDASRQARAGRRRLLDYYLATARVAGWFLSRRTSSGIPAAITRTPPAAPPIRNWRAAMSWLDAEHLNVHDAALYAVRHGFPEHAVAMPAAVNSYLRVTGDWNESRELTHAALSIAAKRYPAAEPALLADLADLEYFTADFERAQELLVRAGRLAAGLGDRMDEANIRMRTAAIQALQGHRNDALANVDAAEQAYQALQDPLGLALVVVFRGLLELMAGQFPDAERHVFVGLEMYRELGNPVGEADALGWLGAVQQGTGRLDQAEMNLMRSLELYRAVRDRMQEASGLYFLASAQLDAGKFDEAQVNLTLALQMCRDGGDAFDEAGILNQLGRLDVERAACQPGSSADLGRAERTLTRALGIYRSRRSAPGEGEVLNNLGRLYVLGGRYLQARECLDTALALAGAEGDPEQARALEGIGLCLLRSGERDHGMLYLRRALVVYQGIESHFGARLAALISELEEDGEQGRPGGPRRGSEQAWPCG
jgi:tetratricopeptide (TPR) repeat protein